MTVGERIKQARKKSNMTQKELAQKAGKGFSTIQKYEMDLVTPPLDVLRKIANVLNVSITDLLTIDSHTRRAAQDDYDRFDADSGNETLKQTAEDVERLTRERDEARSDCAADEQQNMALVEQIATLKADKKRAENALELACRYHRFDDFKTVRSEIEFFAQQAQEQEAEK